MSYVRKRRDSTAPAVETKAEALAEPSVPTPGETTPAAIGADVPLPEMADASAPSAPESSLSDRLREAEHASLLSQQREQRQALERKWQQPVQQLSPVQMLQFRIKEMSPAKRDLFQRRPDAISDKAFSALSDAHIAAMKAGIEEEDSDSYIKAMEAAIGPAPERKKPRPTPMDDDDSGDRDFPRGAPVSRETYSLSSGRPASHEGNKIRLSAIEREHAALSGISETRYAEMKKKMNQEKFASPDPSRWGTDEA